MQQYKFAWPFAVTYPDILIPGEGSLVAFPGDVREFEEAPDDKWVPVVPSTPTPAPSFSVAPASKEETS